MPALCHTSERPTGLGRTACWELKTWALCPPLKGTQSPSLLLRAWLCSVSWILLQAFWMPSESKISLFHKRKTHKTHLLPVTDLSTKSYVVKIKFCPKKPSSCALSPKYPLQFSTLVSLCCGEQRGTSHGSTGNKLVLSWWWEGGRSR